MKTYLVDIWEVALPALERVSSSLRPGAIVACDNTTVSADEYRGYFEFAATVVKWHNGVDAIELSEKQCSESVGQHR